MNVGLLLDKDLFLDYYNPLLCAADIHEAPSLRRQICAFRCNTFDGNPLSFLATS